MPDDVSPWSGSFNHLSTEDQLAVAELVVSGNAVVGAVDDLLGRLKRTRYVALLRDVGTDRIVAAAAWKQPHATYRRDTFTKAGASIAGFESAAELGYVVIAPDMQGKQLSGGLVAAITEKMTEPTFATTDSRTMRNNLERSGFTRIGSEWQGKKGMLSLWIITP